MTNCLSSLRNARLFCYFYSRLGINMRIVIALILSLFLSEGLLAQRSNFRGMSRNWERNKKELMFGLGFTNFLGDLGGLNQIGTGYRPKDLDWPATSFGGLIGYRYRFKPAFATTTMLNIARLRGDDKYTQEIIRKSRNLHFRSPLVSISQRLEWIVYKKETVGKSYNIPGIRGMRDRNNQLYLFAGIGLAWF